MGANIAGIYGAQIFRQEDRPKYRNGFAIAIGVLSAGLALAVFRYIDDKFLRRRRLRQNPELHGEDDSSEGQGNGLEYSKEKAVVESSGIQPPAALNEKSNAVVR